MTNARLELHKAHREGQEKYTYFLLAASGAAIGFAITQTQTATLSLAKIPLGLGVACWSFSFFCGCRHLWQAINLLQQNYQFLRLQEGMHPQFSPDPQLVQAIEKSIEEQSNKSGKWAVWQFRFLIDGAISYIGWHILEMFLRTT